MKTGSHGTEGADDISFYNVGTLTERVNEMS